MSASLIFKQPQQTDQLVRPSYTFLRCVKLSGFSGQFNFHPKPFSFFLKMSNDKLVISYTTQGNRISELDEPYCDFKFEIEVDPSDMSTHQLMDVFSKALAAIGYNEFSIMKGACSLAFNEMRDMEMMNKLVDEYEIDKIPEEFKTQQERKKMYESVNYSSKENDGYEPS